MMIPSNYSINIARFTTTGLRPHFKHFGRVELGTVTDNEARIAFNLVADRFPADEGWSLTLDYAECTGTEILRRYASEPTQ